MKYHSALMYHMDRHNVAFDLFYKGLQRLLHLQINGFKKCVYVKAMSSALYSCP